MRIINNRRSPETVKDFEVLSVNEQGSLWPRCRTCHHIAQCHDTHILADGPVDNACCEVGPGKCSDCGVWSDKVRCKCKGYDGPVNVEALVKLLNEQVI